MYRYIYSALLCSILIVTPAYSEEVINPFGDIKWDDNIVQAIEKINSIQGIEEAVLRINHENGVRNGTPTKITSVVNKDEILAKVSAAGEIYFEEGKDFGADRTDESRHMVIDGNDYLLLGGRQARLFSDNRIIFQTGGIKIQAGPILINNVPFMIEARFVGNYGLMVKDIKNVVTVRVHDTNYYIPFYLHEVELTALIKTDDESEKNITNIIFNKYKAQLSTICKEYDKTKKKFKVKCKNDYSDNMEHTLRLTTNNGRYSILYLNDKAGDKLSNIFQDYISMSSSKKNIEKAKDKKDITNSL